MHGPEGMVLYEWFILRPLQEKTGDGFRVAAPGWLNVRQQAEQSLHELQQNLAPGPSAYWELQ